MATIINGQTLYYADVVNGQVFITPHKVIAAGAKQYTVQGYRCRHGDTRHGFAPTPAEALALACARAERKLERCAQSAADAAQDVQALKRFQNAGRTKSEASVTRMRTCGSVTVHDECRDMEDFPLYLIIANELCDAGYTVSIEYPIYIEITEPTGERCTIGRDSHDGNWTIGTDMARDQVTLDADGDFDGDTDDDTATGILNALDAYMDRGNYPTAAERRQADRDEHEARNTRR